LKNFLVFDSARLRLQGFGPMPTFTSISRVGQNHVYSPHMTVYLVMPLPKTLYIYCIGIYGSGQPYSYHTQSSGLPGTENKGP